MGELNELKQILLTQLQKLVQDKIDNALNSIESAKEARDNETKSSVGDKYETGRAMMQFEIEKNKVQLSKANQLKNDLAKIDVGKIFQRVEFGSIVITKNGNYFISIGLGKVALGNESFFCISAASPIGKILMGKTVGDKINFQGKKIEITDIM